ncbi:MAG TPA: toll/interleukin-1 receptor domain-containing protein [Thermoanaerobaculia bacterium]|nr:toll/interleukin-1 receptor domain-containing protein [Thermoanaerobaculia bacterium]
MKTVFLSHVGEEAPLALALKQWAESSFAGQCQIFVSASAKDLPPGTKWFEQIDSALADAITMLVLCSPLSVKQPWINFEAGCAWIKKIPVIPICHSGQEVGELPQPLATFQAITTRDPNFSTRLLEALAKHLGFPQTPRIDHISMMRDLSEAERSILVEKIARKTVVKVDNVVGELTTLGVSGTDDLTVTDFRCRITERTDRSWKFFWKISVTNQSAVRTGFMTQVDFQDGDGFSLNNHLGIHPRRLEPGENSDHSDHTTIAITNANRIARVSAVASTYSRENPSR